MKTNPNDISINGMAEHLANRLLGTTLEGSDLTEARPKTRRPRRGESGAEPVMTQAEVARLLGLSERAVRDIEKRAIAKLRNHPQFRELEQLYFGRSRREESLEFAPRLTDRERAAVWKLARSAKDARALEKAIHKFGL